MPIFFCCRLDPNIDIEALDIPVNAVATALKDFFSKHLPPLFDKDLMTELEEIACMSWCRNLFNRCTNEINFFFSI